MTEFAAVDENLQGCFRALALGRAQAEVRLLGGMRIISLGVRFQMFNAAYLAFPVENEGDFDRRIAAAAVHFGARGMEWSLWLCEGQLPDAVNQRAHRTLSRRGLSLATQMPGMLAGSLLAPGRELPECAVREVCSEAELRDFCEIGSRCFRVPRDWFEEVFDVGTMARPTFRAWVGYVDGQAVGTAATIVSGGALGIYNVATIPEWRRRGYGEALVRESVAREQARHGPLPLVLQSTAAGQTIYERMGFATVTKFRVWVS